MNGRFATVLVAGLVVILLAACGGGGPDASSPVSVVTAPAGFPIEPQKAVVAPNLCVTSPDGHTTVGAQCLVTETAAGPVKTALKSAPRGALQTVAPTTSPISPDEFMDAAERILPNLFYPPAKTTPADGFVYRYYADTNSFIGIKDGGVYTLFMNDDKQVKYIAQMDTFTCAVRPTSAECPQVYRYARMTLVVFANQGATIGVINPDNTVTPLINSTGYTTGASFPIALCGIYDTLLPDGRPLATCQTTAVGNLRRNFPINPLTNELMAEYTGAIPAGAVAHDVGYGTFGATPYVTQNVSLLGRFIDVPTVGTYYITNTDSLNLRFTSDGFATNSVIHVGDHKYLTNFSNP